MTIEHVVEIQSEVSLPEDLDLTYLRVAALATLRQQRVENPVELTVVVSDDEALRALNRRFRGVDHTTDVLAFTNETRGPFGAGVSGQPRYLGDVVISLPQAERQAAEAGASLREELQLLIVHGTLHLLGYDHATATEKTRMWKVQARLMELLGIRLPLPD
ncbi:MAG: rRNA maturation RNase YbeY [Anaerolineae bacterium]